MSDEQWQGLQPLAPHVNCRLILFEFRWTIGYHQKTSSWYYYISDRSPWLGGEDQAMIVITCPKCRAELEISNQQGGKVIKCPECGASLKVPMPRKEAPSKETQIKTAPSKPMAAVPAKARAPERKESASRQPLRKSSAKPAATSPWLIIGIVCGRLAFLAIVATDVDTIALRST